MPPGARWRDPLARNDGLHFADRVKLLNQFNRFCPAGKSLLIFRNRVKPLLQKYFASRPTQISSLIRTVSFRQEGRIARRHETRDGMRWTQRRQASNSEPDE
jgi:hypothetical protein